MGNPKNQRRRRMAKEKSHRDDRYQRDFKRWRWEVIKEIERRIKGKMTWNMEEDLIYYSYTRGHTIFSVAQHEINRALEIARSVGNVALHQSYGKDNSGFVVGK